MKRGSGVVWGIAGAVGVGALLMMSNESHAAPALPTRRKIKGDPLIVTAKRPTPNKAKAPQKVATAPGLLRSQLAGVSDVQWTKFIQAMGDGDNANGISKTYHLGLFHFSMPRLADLGMVANVRRGDYQGRQVWLGDFLPPLTLAKFLGSPSVQYRALALSTGDYANRIADLYGDLIKGGRVVDGQKLTPSGLVAVAHRAGLKGLGSWLAKESDRKKFPNTTAAFRAANGIF